jgi:ubiquinone/menaquinone biosynthesis C-methylase UbiE
MPDVYATITEADVAMQERLADVLELRAADPRQRAMLEEYTGRLELADESELLEVGCGTGAVSRYLATLPGVAHVTGLDPSPLFVERACELAGDAPVDFVAGDGRALPLADASFDAVVFHTSLCHMPERERAIAEAHRVLRPGGRIAVFDGDYVTMTMALDARDPLQSCAEAVLEMLVYDPWLMRRIAPLLADAGFADVRVAGHAYTSAGGTDYFLALVDRGADALAATGTVRPELAAALKDEGRARMQAGTFFGHIAYVSALARRP